MHGHHEVQETGGMLWSILYSGVYSIVVASQKKNHWK